MPFEPRRDLRRGRAPRRRTGDGAHDHEVRRALDAVTDGHGAFVWTAEAGTGRSTTLERVVQGLEASPQARRLVIVRMVGAHGVGGPAHGTGVESLIAQLTHVTGVQVPEHLVEGLDIGASTASTVSAPNDDRERESSRMSDDGTFGQPSFDARIPEVVAVALAEFIGQILTERLLVVVADDLDRLDPFSCGVLVSLVAQRQIGVVLLATAEDPALVSSLPHPVEVRDVPPFTPDDALALLSSERRLPVAPMVAAQLVEQLSGNAAAIAQTGRLLTPEQLSGGSLLPDPLPAVPAVRAKFLDALNSLDDLDRFVMLVAAIAVVDRTEVLLRATEMSMSEILDGPIADHLALVSGRFTFLDPRMRSLVHAEASLAERTSAHRQLATVHEELGDGGIAVWHRALSSLAGDESLVDGLLALARQLLDSGEVLWAYEAAREAASQGQDDAVSRTEAYALAGRAALECGCVYDAARCLRQAARSAEPRLEAEILPALVTALTLTEGQVPDDVVDHHVTLVQQALGVLNDPTELEGDLAAMTSAVITALATAARLHAERGDGAAAARSLAGATKLCERTGAARAEVDLATAWLHLFGVGEGVVQMRRDLIGSLSAEHEGYWHVCKALSAAREDAHDAALRTLASALAGLAPVHSDVRRSTPEGRAASAFVQAHLRLARALVLMWSGDISGASDELASAAFELPIGVAFAGIATCLARRLDLAVHGEVSALATALEETSFSPLTRPVRLGLIIDRAVVAQFSGHYIEAATLLEVVDERENASTVSPLPIPGIDSVSLWVAAGRVDEARRAADRAQIAVKALPEPLRDAALVRMQLALADVSSLAPVRTEAMGVAHGLYSQFERARIELGIGSALARCGDSTGARSHLLMAAELFGDSGAAAWARLAAGELLRVVPLSDGAARDVVRAVLPDGSNDRGRDGGGGSADYGTAADPWQMARDGGRLGAQAMPGVSARYGGRGVTDDVQDRHRAVRGPAELEHARQLRRERWATALTERELDVAMLVAEGASNRAVADQLFLSVRTVEVHLGRVFRKLGVKSRVELAVLAHRV